MVRDGFQVVSLCDSDMDRGRDCIFCAGRSEAGADDGRHSVGREVGNCRVDGEGCGGGRRDGDCEEVGKEG